MSYVAPKDYSQDAHIVEAATRRMAGDLDLDWMAIRGEPAAYGPRDPRRGLTLDDIDRGAYAAARLPEIVRHNFSMAPRGAILPEGLPSLGYTLNRKSEIWSDRAAALFEEGKSRHWAPSHAVPWATLDAIDPIDRGELARRQLATVLISAGLVASDVAARWEWHMNQEFHEVKYLLCVQMIDGARIAEAFRKRALYGSGSLGIDSPAVGELLKMIFESDTYPMASASMNLLLFSWVQALGRHFEFHATQAADGFLGTRLAQDASRFLAYGIDHVRGLITARPNEAEVLHEHLDLVENGLVGMLGASEVIEPLILLNGSLDVVVAFYARTANEYFTRCAAAGLPDRPARSPVPDFIRILRG